MSTTRENKHGEYEAQFVFYKNSWRRVRLDIGTRWKLKIETEQKWIRACNNAVAGIMKKGFKGIEKNNAQMEMEKKKT